MEIRLDYGSQAGMTEANKKVLDNITNNNYNTYV
jgi:hypothetical protein